MSRDGWGTLVFSSSTAQHTCSSAADADTVERFEHNTLCRSRPTGKSEAKADQFRHILLVMASAQPLSAFALVESALLPLSGDGGIFNRCLEYLGDTPTIIMTLLDGEADDGEDGAGAATGSAGSIWSHVVSFMDAFTLASLEVTCRGAYFSDGWKTADRWVEWDQPLFETARAARPTCSRSESRLTCLGSYVYTTKWSRCEFVADGRRSFPIAFERDGKSRFRVLQFAVFHLSALYDMDADCRSWKYKPRKPASYVSAGCVCPISDAIGSESGWRRIPVRVKHYSDDGTKTVSNRR